MVVESCGKSFSNKKCEKRAGAGERPGIYFILSVQDGAFDTNEIGSV